MPSISIFSVLAIVMALIFIYTWWEDTRYTIVVDKKGLVGWLKTSHGRGSLYFLLILLLPVLYVNFSGANRPWMGFMLYRDVVLAASVIVAFLISLGWAYYLYSLDIFEPERLVFMLLMFALGCASLWFLWPIGDQLFSLTEWKLNGEFWNDWWYCVIRIGLLEEVVKIIPFLLILIFTKQINEPFDYLLYGALSALAFAFLENIQYLSNTQLNAVFGRALFSSVSHMFDTSVVCYTMVLAKYRKAWWQWLALPVGLVLASLAHGFYDFWLISDVVNDYYFITFIFLLITLQLWVIMKNNLLNISPFFDVNVKLRSDRFKYLVINTMLTAVHIAYILKFLIATRTEANALIVKSWLSYAYVLMFISMSFSSMEIIPQYVRKLNVPLNLLKILIPNLSALPNVSGSMVSLTKFRPKRKQTNILFEGVLKGRLERRVVIDGFTSWYLFKANDDQQKLPFTYLALRAKNPHEALNSNQATEVKLLGVPADYEIYNGTLNRKKTRFLGYALIKESAKTAVVV